MLRLSRYLLAGLTAGFAILLSTFALLRLNHYNRPGLVVAAVATYLVVLLVSVSAVSSIQIPLWLALLAFGVTLVEPFVMTGEHNGPLSGDYDTWYVTGNALLLGVIAVRGFTLLATLGGVIELALVIYIGGVSHFSQSGIIGAELLIGSCIAIAIGLRRAEAQIKQIQDLTLALETQRLEAEVAHDEHELQVTRLAAEVMPTLELIAAGAKLTEPQRIQILELEIQLRDEVAGGRLITAELSQAIAKARAAGAEVEVVDQGGSHSVTDEELSELLSVAILTISSAVAGDRVRLTAPAEADHVLRLTKTRPGVVTPDLDLKLGDR